MRLESSGHRQTAASICGNSEHGAEDQQRGSHFLHAGQVHVSSKPEFVILILGSCAGVCIWDPVSGIGGAAHYLLPSWDGRGSASPRYGTVAIETLLERLVEAGAKREQLVAKVFGGGCLFDSMREGEAQKESLGGRNVETALTLLAKARIPVVNAEVGKDRGQRIMFHTATGDSVVTNL
jgi:chemotaxis protein CheD